MLKALKILAVSIYAVCGGLFVLFAIPQVGWKALSVATGSMTPAIPQGSLVIIHRTPPSQIKVGDVVTYKDAAKPGQTITHRVTAETTENNIPIFTTKGDANQVADPKVAGGSIVGVVRYHFAGIGKVVSWLRTPLGIILVVAIPALVIITGEFRLMIVRLQRYAREEAEEHAASRQAEREQKRPLAATTELPRPRPRRKPRPLIWVAALILFPALAFGVQATRSQLITSARLTDNTIVTAETTPPSTNGTCPSGTTSVSITNTGSGSTNKVSTSITCTFTSTNNSSTTIINSSSQTSTSGSVTTTGNTTSSNTQSGNASNSNSNTSNITITNSL